MVNQGLNLSLNELKLIAEHRNTRDYENKSPKDLIKVLRGSRPKPGIEEDKLKKVKKDFYNLRHKFSKKDADKYKKLFYNIKNYRNFSELEIEEIKRLKEIKKRFNRLEKSLDFKKPHKDINTIHYEDLNSDKELNIEDANDDECRKIESVRRLFEDLNKDYYKPRVVDRSFAGEVNNYIKYISEGDKDEKLSPGEYLNMIRPDLRDLLNRHKPIERLNNNNNNNDDNNNDRGEWKITLKLHIKCISTKRFIETRTMQPKSRQVEVYMGNDTENAIDTLFNILFKVYKKHQIKEEPNLFPIVSNF